MMSKFRAILKKFVEIVTFIEEFLKEYSGKLELQENNFYQIENIIKLPPIY